MTVLQRYLGKEEVLFPVRIGDVFTRATSLKACLPGDCNPTEEEKLVLLLAFMPHLSPQVLDIFFIRNKELDRPYTEFGGWRGGEHPGFLPTGQTALFLIEQGICIHHSSGLSDPMDSPDDPQQTLSLLSRMFGKDHWFNKYHILYLEEAGKGEPVLSGKLMITHEFLFKCLYGIEYQPEYRPDFPARRITTRLDWTDLVLPYQLREEIEDITRWLSCQHQIRENWKLDRIFTPGYRSLFYGPPGTGKTLTATLLGKQQKLEVYRVDLSMIVSKYIGETEKNLAKVFDLAESREWILFFDEADALFGQRTETQSSNDRHANQEVAYLLQRIEDFPGMVILATNLKENLDEAFFRRFQSVLYFPMPDRNLRLSLWKKMLPPVWLPPEDDSLLRLAAEYPLSGGSIVNVIRNCAIRLHGKNPPLLTESILKYALEREEFKEGKITRR